MRVQEIMTRDVECIEPNRTLQEAASRMKAIDVGPLPVCENDHLVGMVTDRDIVVRAVAQGHNPRMEKVCDVMTRDVACCTEDQDIEQAARLMNHKQIRHLVVNFSFAVALAMSDHRRVVSEIDQLLGRDFLVVHLGRELFLVSLQVAGFPDDESGGIGGKHHDGYRR